MKTFKFDGYNVGDRLLEGVMFDVTVDDDLNIVDVKVIPEHEDYFNQFNTQYWYDQIKEISKDIILEHLDEQYL